MRSEVDVFVDLEKQVTVAKSEVFWAEEKVFEELSANRMFFFDMNKIFPDSETLTVKVKVRNGDEFDIEEGEKLARIKLYRKYHRRVNVYLKELKKEFRKANEILNKNYHKHYDSYEMLDEKFFMFRTQ